MSLEGKVQRPFVAYQMRINFFQLHFGSIVKIDSVTKDTLNWAISRNGILFWCIQLSLELVFAFFTLFLCLKMQIAGSIKRDSTAKGVPRALMASETLLVINIARQHQRWLTIASNLSICVLLRLHHYVNMSKTIIRRYSQLLLLLLENEFSVVCVFFKCCLNALLDTTTSRASRKCFTSKRCTKN